MTKHLITLLFTALLVFVYCKVERNNLLDERGEHYDPPMLEIDTSLTTVKADDTTHFDSITIALYGNKPESRFQIKLDTLEWTEWQSAGEFKFEGLKDGKHNILIRTKYEGGNIIIDYSINFYVQVAGFKPSYILKNDTNIVVGTGAELHIIAFATGMEPIEYQWIKENDSSQQQTGDTLSINEITILETGTYRCIAKNLYGADTSRKYNVSLRLQQEDTVKHKIVIETTRGGNVVLSPAKEEYLTGEVLFVKAIADSGYEFDHWDGDIMSDYNSLIITVTEALMFRAVFAPIISGDCIEMNSGENISNAIRTVIRSQKQGVLCVGSGFYNNGTIKVNGDLKIIIK